MIIACFYYMLVFDTKTVKQKRTYCTITVYIYSSTVCMELDFDYPAILKISFFASINLMTTKLFLIGISPSAKLTFELQNWFLGCCLVASWQSSNVVFSTAVGNMLGIFGP